MDYISAIMQIDSHFPIPAGGGRPTEREFVETLRSMKLGDSVSVPARDIIRFLAAAQHQTIRVKRRQFRDGSYRVWVVDDGSAALARQLPLTLDGSGELKGGPKAPQ